MQRQNNFLPKNSKTKSKNVKFVSNNQFAVLASEFDSDESTHKAVESSIPSIETSTSAVEYQIDLELGENSPRSASTSEFDLDDKDYDRPPFNGSNCFSRGNHIYDYSDDFPQSAFAFSASRQQSVNFADDFNGESTSGFEYPRSRQYREKQSEYLEELEDAEFEELRIFDSISRIHDSIVNPAGLDLDELAFFNLLVDSAGESTPRIEDQILIEDPPRCATIPPSFKETDNSKTRRVIECLLEDFASLYTFDSFQTPISLRVRLPNISQLEGCTGRDDFNINLALRNPKTIATIHDWIHVNYPNTMRENTLLIVVLEKRVNFSLRPKPPVVPARDIEGSFVHALVNGAETAANPDDANLKVGGGGSSSKVKAPKAKASDVKDSNAKTFEAKAPAKKERVTPARHESWPESAKIIELLAAANETEDGKTASITCFIKGNFEDFQTWCYHETGKKSIQIGTGKEDSIRVRIFKGDRKDFTGGGSRKDSKR